MNLLRSLIVVAAILAGAALWAVDAASSDPNSGPVPLGDSSDLTLLGAPEFPPEFVNGYAKLGWERLAYFKFDESSFGKPSGVDARRTAAAVQIPDDVKQWNGKKAVVTGYMLPLKLEKGLVSEFLLQRNTLGCCFGFGLQMPEWITVKLAKPMKPVLDAPLAVYGVLKVGAVFEGGSGGLAAIYEIVPDKLETPKP